MANPTLDSTAMTQRGSFVNDDNGIPVPMFNTKYITTQTTTLVKTGAGFLHSITFNAPAANGTCELDDAITQTNPFAIITSSGTVPCTLVYDIMFATGLSITTGTANQNITVSYR